MTPRRLSPFTPRGFAGATLIGLAVLAAAALPCLAASPPAAVGERGMVVTPETHATAVGVEILRRGGNAVDASVAVAFALAVTYPRAGSLGGGGFLLRRGADGTHQALDFRERAPAALRPELFQNEQGRPVPDRAVRGGLSVGVPGVPAGLAEAHRRWGSLPWKELVRPAIRLAERGFRISRRTAETFHSRQELLSEQAAARVIFLPGDRSPREGDLLVQRDLAGLLKRIARRGPAAFYRGEMARAIAGAVQQAGGVMTEEDLASYRVALREPVRGTYRGYTVVSFPPPSSGGIALLQILKMLERFDLAASGFGSSLTVHRMVEAERRAFADRARWLGDPDFYDVPVRGLLDPAYLASRAATIRDDRATPSRNVSAGDPPGAEPTDTLHFSIADRDGGAVALTETLNSWYGSGVVPPGTGVLLNNEMDDFALAPGVPNQFGLLGGEANAVAGGKRPLSSMTPTIVEAKDGAPGPLLVLGSPGGPRIITSVVQVLINVVDHRMPLQEAVDAPRFHHQWLPDRIDHEPRAFPADVARVLEARGHTLHERASIGNVAAVLRRPDGTYEGAADPRDEGTAGGVRRGQRARRSR